MINNNIPFCWIIIHHFEIMVGGGLLYIIFHFMGSSSRYIHHLVPQMERTSHNFYIVDLSSNSYVLLRNTLKLRWNWNIIEIQTY